MCVCVCVCVYVCVHTCISVCACMGVEYVCLPVTYSTETKTCPRSPVEEVEADVRQHGPEAVADAVIGVLREGDLLKA